MKYEERRTQVLNLLARGLILQGEAAQLAGVSRQAVHKWVKQAGFNPARARRQKLRALMDDHR